MRPHDMRTDAWFSGFADGEGSFMIVTETSVKLMPRFTIGLRADDRPILEELQRAFGGRLCAGLARNGSAPTCNWIVRTKQELAGLVRYFDQFPLRAKKAGDYKVWRLAVQIYCAEGGKDHRLEELRDALRAGRAFAADEPEFVLQPAEQMALLRLRETS